MFEVKAKEGLGRIGLLKTKSGSIETPCLMPVINPNIEVISSRDLQERFKVDLLITNAYIIWKKPDLREKALKKGVHGLLGVNIPVMTDSGAYQLYSYGDIEVSNRDIVFFQRDIESDIAVILDVPVYGGREETLKAVKETIKRAKEFSEMNISSGTLWVGPIQGGSFPDLIKFSCREMTRFPFDIYAIGTVVPFLESYEFRKIIERQVIPVKLEIPINKPIHLFGAGHPIFFAFSVAFGCDIFDSAAYSLYAKQHRYMTLIGTRKIENLSYLPCSCPICSQIELKELVEMPEEEKVKKIAEHNLWVSLQEIKTIKQAIKEGSLLNLLQERARCHPKLYECLSLIEKYSDLLEKYDPVVKGRTFIYSGRESFFRPELIRARKRLKERVLPAEGEIVYPFGLVPSSLRETYPFNMACKVPEDPCLLEKLKEDFSDYRLERGGRNSLEKIREILDYQYGKGVGRKIFDLNVKIEFSKKTGRVRRIYRGDELIATLVPGRGLFVLKGEGVKRLFRSLPRGKYCIVAKDEAIQFLKKGRSLFAKFVLDCDHEIRAAEEVFIVNKEWNLVGYGRALMSCEEMKFFRRGAAVKVREVFGVDDFH